MIRRFLCRFVGCFRCTIHDTPEGIGGRCIDCGKIHGWMTRSELRALSDRKV